MPISTDTSCKGETICDAAGASEQFPTAEDNSAKTASSDIERAKALLEKENLSCVLCRGEKTYTSAKQGISPMVDFITLKTDLRGFSAADKIVGKAAALLFALADVNAVYAGVMSEQAVCIFRAHHIAYSYAILAKSIVNRSGTGLCPMEQTVADITDPAEALCAIKNTLKALELKASVDRK